MLPVEDNELFITIDADLVVEKLLGLRLYEPIPEGIEKPIIIFRLPAKLGEDKLKIANGFVPLVAVNVDNPSFVPDTG